MDKEELVEAIVAAVMAAKNETTKESTKGSAKFDSKLYHEIAFEAGVSTVPVKYRGICSAVARGTISKQKGLEMIEALKVQK